MSRMSATEYLNDTSPDAQAMQLDLLRHMTPQERIEKMCALSQSLREMAFQAIRRRHPQLDEAEVRLKFIDLTYGQTLADDVRRSQGAVR